MEDEIETCGKCSSTNHTTNFHIIRKLVYYNVDYTVTKICTKCLGDNHPRKYCEIYNSYVKDPNDSDSYLKYLDKIAELKREKIYINNIINCELYISNLKIFHQYTLEYKLKILIENDHNPFCTLKPLWDIVYKEHSKEEVEYMMRELSY